jgi:hypothetical protein
MVAIETDLGVGGVIHEPTLSFLCDLATHAEVLHKPSSRVLTYAL